MDTLLHLLLTPTNSEVHASNSNRASDAKYSIIAPANGVPPASGHVGTILTLFKCSPSMEGVITLKRKLDLYFETIHRKSKPDKMFSFDMCRSCNFADVLKKYPHCLRNKIYCNTQQEVNAYTHLIDMIRSDGRWVLPVPQIPSNAPSKSHKKVKSAIVTSPAKPDHKFSEVKVAPDPEADAILTTLICTNFQVGNPVHTHKSEWCKLYAETENQLRTIEQRIYSRLTILYGANSDKNLGSYLQKLKRSLRDYWTSVHLPDFEDKIFYIPTGRWRNSTSKDYVMVGHRIFAESSEAIALFSRFLGSLDSGSTHEPRATSRVQPPDIRDRQGSNSRSTIIQGGVLSSSTQIPAVPVTIPQIPSEGSILLEPTNWNHIRAMVWATEPQKLARWGIPSYFEGARGRCFACQKPVSIINFQAAHIVARARGGPDTVENLRVSCEPCNKGVGGMSVSHAYEWCFRNAMPGVSLVPRSDKDALIGELLYRESLLLEHLRNANRLPFTELDRKQTGMKAPVETRLDASWVKFREVLPSLPLQTRIVLQRDAPGTKVSSTVDTPPVVMETQNVNSNMGTTIRPQKSRSIFRGAKTRKESSNKKSDCCLM